MRRRVMLTDAEGFQSEGVAYGGTLEFTERTAETVSFECPGCTRFAIINENPDLTTEKAFFRMLLADEKETVCSASGNNGADTSTHAAYSTGTSYTIYWPIVDFTESGVNIRFAAGGDSGYRKCFQPATYSWIAW